MPSAGSSDSAAAEIVFRNVTKRYAGGRAAAVNDLSLTMLLMFAAGVALPLIDGVLNAATPVIAANAATLVMAVALIGRKVRFRQNTHHGGPGGRGFAL